MSSFINIDGNFIKDAKLIRTYLKEIKKGDLWQGGYSIASITSLITGEQPK